MRKFVDKHTSNLNNKQSKNHSKGFSYNYSHLNIKEGVDFYFYY